MRIANEVTELVGNTPLIRLPEGGKAGLFLKAEWFNVGGSVKDRPALSMITRYGPQPSLGRVRRWASAPAI